jgi:hypothetical protein
MCFGMRDWNVFLVRNATPETGACFLPNRVKNEAAYTKVHSSKKTLKDKFLVIPQ